jgi:DNA ligase 1
MDRPMLAATYRDGVELSFPLLATPKIDGVRALVVDGRLVSRSFRPIPNIILRKELEHLLPEGADGELSCGSLYETISVVMSEYREDCHVTFSWFDWAYDLDAPYGERAALVREHTRDRDLKAEHVKVVPLVPNRIDDARDLDRYEAAMLARGHEGVVVRAPHGRYKCGRSTLKEGLMIKIKRDDDFEATIVGTEELMHNANEAQADNFGNAKRNSSKLHLAPGDTLGAIVARDAGGKTFRCGTGFSSDQRDALWANRDAIVGHLVKYKCAGRGSRGLPRSPVFVGMRHPDDI